MIKNTYYNLSPEKRLKILDAAKKEFSRVPVSNAKISNIISMAEIPRGSFYQYFDTLNDVFLAVLEDIGKGKQADLISFIEDSKGDIFEAALRMFDSEYVYYTNSVGGDMLLNILEFSNMFNLKGIQYFNGNNDVEKMSIVNKLNLENLRVKIRREIEALLFLIFTCISENVRFSTLNNLDKETAVQRFKIQLEIIKYGTYAS